MRDQRKGNFHCSSIYFNVNQQKGEGGGGGEEKKSKSSLPLLLRHNKVAICMEMMKIECLHTQKAHSGPFLECKDDKWEL